MNILLNILAFFIAIFMLVLVHEFGHFWVARRLGVVVERFSIGFGKPLIKWRAKSGVEYVLAPILLGGYVKLDDSSYTAASVWRRMAIMLAGVCGNLIFAVFLFWLMFSIGFKSPKAIIGKIVPHSIAAEAGLKVGAEINTIDSSRVDDWQEASMAIVMRMGDRGQMAINQQKLDLSSWKVSKLNPDPLQGLGLVPYYPNVTPVVERVAKGSAAAHMGMVYRD